MRVWAWLALALLLGCEQKPLPSGIRSELEPVFSKVDSARHHGEPVESNRLYLDSMLAIFEPLSLDEVLWKCEFFHWYHTEYRWGEYEEANRYVDEALLQFAERGVREKNLEKYQRWLLFKGDILVNLKRLNEAFIYYYRAKNDLNIGWDLCKTSRFSTRLGMVRYKQRNYADARRYFQQAFDEFERCTAGNTYTDYYTVVTEPQGLLNGIAWFYELDHQPDSALVYYRRAFAFLERKSIDFPHEAKAAAVAKGIIYGNLGGLLAKQGRYGEAEKHLVESISINSKPGYDHRDALTAQIKLAELYTSVGRLPEAEKVLKQSRAAQDTIRNEDTEQRWRRVWWLYSEKAMDLTARHEAYQAYHEYKDSLATANQAMMGVDLVREFEYIEKSRELTALELKNRMSVLLLVIVALILVLVLVIVYFIYVSWRRSNRHVRHLEAKNEEINGKNEKLQLALSALHASQQDNTRIMAMVAHDLKTPISNIKMATDVVRRDSASFSERQLKFMDIIGRSNQQALDLLDGIMQSHLADDPEHVEDIDLETMVLDCVEFMQVRAAEKEQVLTVTTAPIAFRGSREKLWRVISNLIGNAVKFTPNQGTVTVRLYSEDRNAIIEVRDTGIGIPEEFRAIIFEPGRMTRRAGTAGEPSFGLGLTIVNQIVTRYNGRISVDRAPDYGSIFRVELPID